MATVVELAWAAGLFDGEGSVYLRSAGHYPAAGAMLTLEMTDRPTVEAFLRILAPHGQLTGPRIVGQRATKPLWRWRASRQIDVAQGALVMLPYLVTKRSQVQAALQTCKAWAFTAAPVGSSL